VKPSSKVGSATTVSVSAALPDSDVSSAVSSPERSASREESPLIKSTFPAKNASRTCCSVFVELPDATR
jgi:hypothetical protein